MPKHPAEPFRIKMVEPIRLISSKERKQAMIHAGYNLFSVPAKDVYIDLLTDSGTGAMSQAQWASIMVGDESYAGARSFYRLKEVIQDIFGFEFFVPTHQGRAAENILAALLVNKDSYIPSNMHFDTTDANLRARGGRPVNLINDQAFNISAREPFKGNMDVDKLNKWIMETGSEIFPLAVSLSRITPAAANQYRLKISKRLRLFTINTRSLFLSMLAVMQKIAILLNCVNLATQIKLLWKLPGKFFLWQTVLG
jgi:tryptophanase